MPWNIDDTRIQNIRELTPPRALISDLPTREESRQLVAETRDALHHILNGRDPRLAVIVGPCSIHDTNAALDYAHKLKAMSAPLADDLLVIMRVYFEKPRTTVGWKGLINDPYLDNSFQINEGLHRARKLLLDLQHMGIPAATEYLDMITPQYIADLISWGAIGARTTESQVHRQLASGLSCPVGFKNGTDGNLKIALDAIRAALVGHCFLSVTKEGHSAIVETKGNGDCHVILRGGKTTNYDEESVNQAISQLRGAGLAPRLMVDFSHANSSKDYRNQRKVAEDVAAQIEHGQTGIFGVMIESNIVAGRQDLIPGRELMFGQSITDECIDLAETEAVLQRLARAQRASRERVGFSTGFGG
jgi:3-deoxy-7-phosphoheptulonate synthase